MDLVLPIAGLSSRFANLTETPKWALRIGEEYLLELSLRSITKAVQVDRVFIVYRASDKEVLFQVMSEIETVCEVVLVQLESPTRGQAETVFQCVSMECLKNGFLIWNGDSYLKPGWQASGALAGNLFAISQLPGHHWSFARLKGNRIVQTAEKDRISQWASVGLYGWSSTELYLDCYEHELMVNGGELYVAPLYNHAIESGAEVSAVKVSRNKFLSMGTPSEMRNSADLMGRTVLDSFNPESEVREFF